MNIINIEHISKIFGEKVIFDDASFGIQEGDKIGIVGVNGTGKTTLLKLTAGLEETDSGQIIRQNGLKIAYLAQSPSFPKDATVTSCMESCEDFWRVQSILTKLGITEYEMKVEQLSGGQRRKLALAVVLASDFDVLLLDEPTNHLDAQMIVWLEDYLREFRGTILMVTHDRYFLDRTTNKILEISHGKMYSYEANYSVFLEQKAAREEMELASERKRQSILRIELEWAKRGCRARSTKQRARLERLEALKNKTAPIKDPEVELGSIETRMGKKTIEFHHVGKHYGDKTILEDYSYIFLKNQKVGIIGPNGCGKSTLMKMIAGLIEPDSGRIEIGDTIRIGYLSQEEHHMDDRERVIDYIKEIGEYVTTREGRISASQMLERFLFTPDMQYAPIGKLSGGEKRRLYLLGVLCENMNVLLLDEAGNNLDIPTLTILEDYLNSFSGIVIAVSHDRYFLDNIADRILAFDGEGHLEQYEGGYTDYLEARRTVPEGQLSHAGVPLHSDAQKPYRKSSREQAARADSPAGSQNTDIQKKTGENSGLQKRQTEDENSTAAAFGKTSADRRQNRPAKLRFTYKEQREFETIDADIAALEEQIAVLDDEIMANATNSVRLNELTIQKEAAEADLDHKMERWVYLNELAEKIEAQGK